MVFHFISPDIKCTAMGIYENGLMDLPNIVDCLDMSESTFFHALRLYRETGNVEHPRSTTCCRPWKLHFDDLTYMIALINHRPDWFLDELLGLFDTNRFISVHFTTIYCELEHSGVSLKKLRQIAKECDENLRADFVRTMGQYSPEEIGFLDEFSKDECTLHRHRGRSKRGKCVVMRGAFVRGHQVSGEGFLTLDGIVASTIVEGSMTCKKFLAFPWAVLWVLFSVVVPSHCILPLTALLDASHITVSWKVECFGDGQCTHSPWGWNFRACWEVWCTYYWNTSDSLWHWFFLQACTLFSCPHTPQIWNQSRRRSPRSKPGSGITMISFPLVMVFCLMFRSQLMWLHWKMQRVIFFMQGTSRTHSVR